MGNFCSNCGTKRSDAEAKLEENEGKIRLDLSIAFEKNAYFSTYDVKVFVDDEWITTMHHGIDYAGTVYVTPGKHAILFEEASSSYPSTGSTIINISKERVNDAVIIGYPVSGLPNRSVMALKRNKITLID